MRVARRISSGGIEVVAVGDLLDLESLDLRSCSRCLAYKAISFEEGSRKY